MALAPQAVYILSFLRCSPNLFTSGPKTDLRIKAAASPVPSHPGHVATPWLIQARCHWCSLPPALMFSHCWPAPWSFPAGHFPVIPRPAWSTPWGGLVVTHGQDQDFTLLTPTPLTPHWPPRPSMQPVQILLQNPPAQQQVNTTAQLRVIGKHSSLQLVETTNLQFFIFKDTTKSVVVPQFNSDTSYTVFCPHLRYIVIVIFLLEFKFQQYQFPYCCKGVVLTAIFVYLFGGVFIF